jgi:hypothetical protein
MVIRFAWASCGQRLAARDDAAGARARCRACGSRIQVPASSRVDGDDLGETVSALAPQPVAATQRDSPIRRRNLPVRDTGRGAVLIGGGAAAGLTLVGLVVWFTAGRTVTVQPPDGNPPINTATPPNVSGHVALHDGGASARPETSEAPPLMESTTNQASASGPAVGSLPWRDGQTVLRFIPGVGQYLALIQTVSGTTRGMYSTIADRRSVFALDGRGQRLTVGFVAVNGSP